MAFAGGSPPAQAIVEASEANRESRVFGFMVNLVSDIGVKWSVKCSLGYREIEWQKSIF